jgi:hypothetical protein
MLKITHISQIEIYSQEWDEIRLGRFTSSKASSLMGDKILTQDAISYIDQKVGEELTGYSTATEDEQIDDENTQWGNEWEPAAIRKFGEIKGIEYLVTRRVICDPATRFSSTPDGIWVHNKSLDGLEYNVSTLEVKCPRKFARYSLLWRCKTPADLKKASSKYYWQTVDQMDNCDSAVGYFGAFHPKYPEGANIRIIQFNKMDLWDDFKLLKERKKLAVAKFEELRRDFLGI